MDEERRAIVASRLSNAAMAMICARRVRMYVNTETRNGGTVAPTRRGGDRAHAAARQRVSGSVSGDVDGGWTQADRQVVRADRQVVRADTLFRATVFLKVFRATAVGATYIVCAGQRHQGQRHRGQRTSSSRAVDCERAVRTVCARSTPHAVLARSCLGG